MGRPLGWIQPKAQASRMKANSATDRPTRQASARAMRLSAGCSARGLAVESEGLRSIIVPALAKAPMMPIRARTMITFMARIVD